MLRERKLPPIDAKAEDITKAVFGKKVEKKKKDLTPLKEEGQIEIEF